MSIYILIKGIEERIITGYEMRNKLYRPHKSAADTEN